VRKNHESQLASPGVRLKNAQNRSFGKTPNEAIYERADVKRGGADFVSRAPAHPLRLRLRSILPISDLSADDLVVQPATHPLSPRPRERESFPPYSAGSVRSVDRRDVIRSTIYSGITGSLRCRH
jgi:hypothetical protein